jgi:RecA-family ATPase
VAKWIKPDEQASLHEAKGNGHDKAPALPAINCADVARWRGREPPEIVFTIEDLVPQGMVTLLTSQGGAGKTLLLQMAGTIVAAGGMKFLGKAALTGRAAGVFAEDPESVLHVRQPRINEFLDIDYDRIAGRYFPQSYFGLRAQLWRDGRVTPFFGELEQALGQIEARRLLTLDNAALLFSGDENSRPEVTEFLSELNGMADRLGMAFILSAHASKTQDGTSLRVSSGSTAWVNACRSVLDLKAADDKTGPSLTVVKANHAATGTTIPLVWQDRLLVSEAAADAGGILDWIKKQTTEQVFLDLLQKTESEGRRLSDSSQASNYAPRIFARLPANGNYKLRQFESAMDKLFAEGRIKMIEKNRTRRMARTGDGVRCSATH